jgi:outer membrane beta-barrel protein
MTERFGFEVMYQLFSNKSNNTNDALHAKIGTLGANVLEVKNQIAALVTWAPWYAKINVFNWILYFDWYFTGGIGSLSTNLIPSDVAANATSKTFTGYYLGTGQMFHLDENWIVRLDFTNVFFKAPQGVTTGKEVYYNSTTFEIGVGLKL